MQDPQLSWSLDSHQQQLGEPRINKLAKLMKCRRSSWLVKQNSGSYSRVSKRWIFGDSSPKNLELWLMTDPQQIALPLLAAGRALSKRLLEH